MDNLAVFFNQYGAAFSSLALFIVTIVGYGKLSQQTGANTKAIDKLQDGLTEVRIQAARTEAKIDMIMQIVEKRA